MFFRPKLKPTPTKKFIYILSAIILGICLASLLYILTLLFLATALPSYTSWIPTALVGAIAGFFVGRTWWDMVYVKQIWKRGILEKSQTEKKNEG